MPPPGSVARAISTASNTFSEEVRQLIAAGFRGEPLVPVRDLKLDGAQDYGGLAVLDDAWRRFGLDCFLSGLGTPRQQWAAQGDDPGTRRLGAQPCATLLYRLLAERAVGEGMVGQRGGGRSSPNPTPHTHPRKLPENQRS